MTPDFCVEALQEAMERHGKPEIFNTDQGSQFTSTDGIDTLTEAKVQISMDGKGRWIDNVFIERLWRSVKYENVYLHAYQNGADLRKGLREYFGILQCRASSPGVGLPDARRTVLRPHRTQASGMITVTEPIHGASAAARQTARGERVLTKARDRDSININRSGRSTYPGKKSVQRTGATPGHRSRRGANGLGLAIY